MRTAVAILFVLMLMGCAQLYYLDYMVKGLVYSTNRQHFEILKVSDALLDVAKDVTANRRIITYAEN